MAKARLARTSGAELVWTGDLRPEFRKVADGIVGKPLSDEAWAGLVSVVEAYAFLLSFEHDAAGLPAQVEAVEKAAKACIPLIEALELIETDPLGNLLTGLVSDKWQESRGHVHDARKLGSPRIGADLLAQLKELQGALKLTTAELRSGRRNSVKGDAFDEFVGRLDEWQELHGFGLGAYKYDTHGNGNFGRLTELVKAIIGEVPLLYDDQGKLLAKQIRPHKRTDHALGEAVVKARKEHKSHR